MSDTNEQEGEPQSPVLALRDFFGDRKPPAISRKITACVACRKQKIKCRMRNSQPPCTRCEERGLPCTVNRSLQMLMENDIRWKRDVERRMERLGAVIASVAKQSLPSEAAEEAAVRIQAIQASLPSPAAAAEVSHDPVSAEHQLGQDTPNESTGSSVQPQQREGAYVNANDVFIDLSSSAAEVPGFRIIQTPSAAETPGSSDQPSDLISRGIITISDAQKYLNVYRNRLDHFLYGIVGDSDTAADIHRLRKTSAILTGAICAVGSLHLASSDFPACYREFLALAQSSTFIFSNECTSDDVRGFIIGAFWLSSPSRTLIDTAVRLAVEQKMHRSFYQAVRGDLQHYQHARLYYLIYVCDHHLSLVFGRPPMTRDCVVIRRVRDFLQCEHASPDDSRLVSQVLRWHLCSQVFDAFSDEDEQLASIADVAKFRRFSIAIDNLRAEWEDAFSPNSFIGNYPRKGVGLQCLFAKLYLCSRAFRSMGPATAAYAHSNVDVLVGLQEVANSAVVSAKCIIQVIVSDLEIQSFLNGLPTYFHTMIAFAAVFLLKVSLTSPTSTGFTLHFADIRPLLASLVLTLKGVTATMHERHLLVPITNGLESVLHDIERVQATNQAMSVVGNGQPALSTQSDVILPWTQVENLASGFLGQYNFQWQ